ncbi:Regulatory-associated protein of TOR 2 [Nymphaea thermarum]|nr:Regulatory-associated protein of TOR 2 [Nymphaea thermarum]
MKQRLEEHLILFLQPLLFIAKYPHCLSLPPNVDFFGNSDLWHLSYPTTRFGLCVRDFDIIKPQHDMLSNSMNIAGNDNVQAHMSAAGGDLAHIRSTRNHIHTKDNAQANKTATKDEDTLCIATEKGKMCEFVIKSNSNKYGIDGHNFPEAQLMGLQYGAPSTFEHLLPESQPEVRATTIFGLGTLLDVGSHSLRDGLRCDDDCDDDKKIKTELTIVQSLFGVVTDGSPLVRAAVAVVLGRFAFGLNKHLKSIAAAYWKC